MPNPSMLGHLKTWKRRYSAELIVLLIGLLAVHSIFLAGAFRESSTIDREPAGQFGDFVGGYIGTLLSLATVLMLVATLRTQREHFNRQNFEARFLELVKLHRENVAEIDLQGINGRRLFVMLLREFREILKVVCSVSLDSNQPLTRGQALHIAYYCLFYGTGPNSSRMLESALSGFDPELVRRLILHLEDAQNKSTTESSRQFRYTPFEGHQSRLGHYYRHLFQTVRYVDEQNFESNVKYSYVKTLRAQLSTHEQALLLLNSLTPLGHNWWKFRYIQTYRFVQNLPKDFFNKSTELDVIGLFGPNYFEWEEHQPPM